MLDEKYCPDCDQCHPASFFWKDATKSDGFQSYCKDCQKSRYALRSASDTARTCQVCNSIFQGLRCKNCHSQYFKRKRESDPDAKRARDKADRIKHLEKRRSREAEYRESHREERRAYFRTNEKLREKRRKWGWAAHLRERYGLTAEDYDKMVADQAGLCAICNRPPRDKGKRLVVDHCHASKNVRQLLCRHCNSGIGQFEDNIEFLELAINYLRKHST